MQHLQKTRGWVSSPTFNVATFKRSDDPPVPASHCVPQPPRYSGSSSIEVAVPMRLSRKLALPCLAALVCLARCLSASADTAAPADDAVLSSAICSIVYPVDQSPSTRGYQYIF